jgi:DNA polymerase I
MKTEFVLLDADYVMVNSKPVIRLFGSTQDGKSVTVFFQNFFPYFYAKVKSKEKLIEFLEKYKNEIINVCEVEKYEPIGYNEGKSELVKITLRSPSFVPTLREELLRQKFVEKTYEADILFKYRFLADYNLFGMRWYEIEGNPVNSQTVFTSIKIEANSIKEISDRIFEPRILSIDIECLNRGGMPDPKKDQIILISLYFSHEYKGKKSLVLSARKLPFEDTLSFDNEKEMLEEFLKIVREYDPDVIVGYNINNFDIPYLVKRMQFLGIPPLIGRCKKMPKIQKIGERYKVSITGRVIFDIYEILKDLSRKGMYRFKRLGLGDVSKILINEEKVDIDKGEISKFWNGSIEDLKLLIDYSRKDAELAFKVYLKLDVFNSFAELSKLTGLLLQDVLSGAESLRIENLLLREFNRKDFVIPNKPTKEEIEERRKKEVKGAIVLEPKLGLHENVIYLDFKSLYPSIIIEYNICPTTLLLEEKNVDFIISPFGARFVTKNVREGIFPKILKRLIEERDKIKKEMKNEKDEVKKKILDAKQWALKTLANAFYGYTGFIRARFFISEIANSITSYGRYWITTIKNIIEKDLGSEVVYGDTDSLMIKTKSNNLEEIFKEAEEIEREINKRTPENIKMKLEGVFKKILLVTKKKYAGYLFESINDKGKIVMKGIETVRRDWCSLVEEVLSTFLEKILVKGSEKEAIDYLKEIVEKLKRGEIEIEKLAIIKTLSRPITQYKGQQPHVELVKKMIKRGDTNIPSVGDRISYVIVAGPQRIVERAESVEYVKKYKIPIDVNYYLEHQLLPPLERILLALGYTRTQFLVGSKQLSLFSIVNNSNENRVFNSNEIKGFICEKCNTVYRRAPLSLKCFCDGKIKFYSEKGKTEKIII